MHDVDMHCAATGTACRHCAAVMGLALRGDWHCAAVRWVTIPHTDGRSRGGSARTRHSRRSRARVAWRARFRRGARASDLRAPDTRTSVRLLGPCPLARTKVSTLAAVTVYGDAKRSLRWIGDHLISLSHPFFLYVLTKMLDTSEGRGGGGRPSPRV
eukprot:4610239-Prymnesium_polylepis.3